VRVRTIAGAVLGPALALVAVLGVGSPAAASPAASVAAAVDTRWETPTVSLAWDGEKVETADASFVGVPVTVPGDRAVRTLHVRNDGPTAGALRAWVQEVALQPAASDDTFYDDLRLDWETASGAGGASFRQLAAQQRTQVADLVLDAGESTLITVGYAFPASATSGNRSVAGSREASFVLHLEIAGDDPLAGERSEVLSAVDGPATRPLAMTGLEATRLVPAALGALVLGGLLVVVGRRRRTTNRPEEARRAVREGLSPAQGCGSTSSAG